MEPIPDEIFKRKIALRYWLLGAGYHDAAKALAYTEYAYRNRFRKDGITPEFDHPVSIALYLRTLLPGLIYKQETISAAIGHDLREPPYDRPREELEPIFGTRACDAIDLMTKKHRGEDLDIERLFYDMARDPIASVAKPADRVHNLRTMVGVFLPEKQASYADDVDRLFLPALKVSRRLFPEQEPAYENIAHMLTGQRDLVRAMLKAGRSD